jgi:DNA-binding NarL/FixJ family response regulator
MRDEGGRRAPPGRACRGLRAAARGHRARLLTDAGFEVVGQTATADDLLLKVRSYAPDIVITDIRMPPTQTDEGLRAAQELRADHPDVSVLVLSQYVEPSYAMELLAESAEGVGYLLKDRVADVDEFVAAVRRVAEGGSALDPALVTQLVGRRRRQDPLDELTPREREVLGLMAEGRSNQGIAQLLVVTERAVEKHVTSIFSKLRLPPATDDHRRSSQPGVSARLAQVAGADQAGGQAPHDDVRREQRIREAVAAAGRRLACLQDPELARESVECDGQLVSVGRLADLLEVGGSVGRAEEPELVVLRERRGQQRRPTVSARR